MYFDIIPLFILVWHFVSHFKEQTEIEDFWDLVNIEYDTL